MSDPSTPVQPNKDVRSESTPAPSSPELLQVKYKDYQSAIEAIQQLEIELNEFQSSSYELEKELEKELTDLELRNEELLDKVEFLESKLKKNKELGDEKELKLSEENLKLLNQIETMQKDIDDKNSKLVDIEIINDNLEQKERNLKVNEDELMSRYNKLVEKDLLLETEINDLKNLYMKEKLTTQNLTNEVNELKEVIKKSNEDGRSKHNSRSRAVSSSSQVSIPRSNSLLQLHSIRSQSKEMGLKLDDLKNSLNSNEGMINFKKSGTTTKISNTHITTQTTGTLKRSITPKSNGDKVNETRRVLSNTAKDDNHNEEKKTRSKNSIHSSPNSFTLSSLINKKPTNLQTIEGSPNKDEKPPKISKLNKVKLTFGGLL